MELFNFVLGSVALLINLYADQYEKADLELTLKQLEDDAGLPRIRTYDYIIVGGGGAGCVLAKRLSRKHSVLLLEAGGDPVPPTDAFIYYQEVLSNPRINYAYGTVPSDKAGLAHAGMFTEHTGKMLGGSTSHHGLVYNRGHPLDFDKWAELTNNTDWQYKKILKYFKRAEKYIGKLDNPQQKTQHGFNGPLTVDTAVSTPLLPTWLKAGSALHFNTSYDPNGPQQEGFVAEAVSQKRGRRVSTYNAYIKRNREAGNSQKSPNGEDGDSQKLPNGEEEDSHNLPEGEDGIPQKLKIERYSEVFEILIKDGTAYGVLYRRHKIPQIAHASKTVIISAGTVGTPILLMNSGIGPASVLKEAGIPVVKDLPVGIGIGEHPLISLPRYTIKQNAEHLFINLKKQLTEEVLFQFHDEGKGPLVLSLEGQVFLVSARAKSEGEHGWPDLLIQLGQPAFFGEGPPTYFLGVVLVRPKGSNDGRVGFNTEAYKRGLRNSENLAILDINLLSNESDVDVLLEGIKFFLKILEGTTAFRKIGLKIQDPKLPGCSAYKFRTDEYWKCYIRQNVGISYHLTSGCRMGHGSTDSGAVLDSSFNVLGVRGLKVVDASAMPFAPNANIAAAVVMMAEKAAADILRNTEN